ncbi:MAG: I78 family peptidase inhibitor [Pseudomonadota bacterium]|nr:I78 family peptidase inhibitor [Pseudomonadota bacterium]
MLRLSLPCTALMTVALAACTPAPDERQQAIDESEERAEVAAQPASEPEPGDAGACDSVQAQWLVGKVPTDAEVEQARTDSGAEGVRVLKPGVMVTMEFNPSRLNIDVDEAGVVISVRCG